MKNLLFSILGFGILFSQSVFSQGTPPPGYGVMGLPPAGYGTPPPTTVPTYPNSLPPPTVTPAVTAPPPYADPYATAPQPGGVSSYAPQGSGAYTAPPPGAVNYGAKPGPNMVNFNNLEVYYRYMDPKNKELDGAHTIGGSLTVALFNPLYLRIGASWGSGPGGSSGVSGASHANYDFASIRAGAGFHTPLINDRLTFVAEAGLMYSSLRATNSALSFSDGAIYIRPALRFTPLDFLEVQAGVTVTSSDRYDGKVLDLSTYIRVLPMFDIGVGADFGDTSRSFRTSLRLRW